MCQRKLCIAFGRRPKLQATWKNRKQTRIPIHSVPDVFATHLIEKTVVKRQATSLHFDFAGLARCSLQRAKRGPASGVLFGKDDVSG